MVSAESRDGCIVVSLTGNLEVSDAITLEEMVRSYLEKGQRYFILDFSQVVHLNSKGASTLLALHKTINTVKGKMILVALNKNVLKILNIIGLHHVFAVVNSLEDAFTAIGKP